MKINQIFISALLAASIVSCETVVDVDLPEFEPSLVLNGLIYPDTTVSVLLTQNRSALDNSYDFKSIKNATIKLYENDVFIGNLSASDQDGIYTLGYYPQIGKTYRIEAEKSGFEKVSAEISIPGDTADFAIQHITRVKDEYGNYNLKMTYVLKDSIIKNFYEVKLFMKNGYPETKYYDYDLDSLIVVPGYTYWQDWYYWIDGASLDEFSDYTEYEIFTDELFNGRQKEFTLVFSEPYEYENQSDTTYLRLEVRNLTEDYYRYITTQTLQNMTGNSPFAEPVQVYSNIDNGFGIWGAMNNSRGEIIPIKDGKWLK